MAEAPVTIYRVEVDAFAGPDRLSADERVTAGRFADPRDRRSYAAGRAALRQVLSAHLALPVEDLRFARAERGRLVLAPDMPPGPAFNISRTRELVLVGISLTGAIGVDVEPIRPVPDLLAVARRVLRPEACAAITDAPIDERDRRFFREWVRHEARLKCRGTGIVEPGDDDGRVDDLTIDEVHVGPGHAAAVAMVGHRVAWEVVDLDGRTGEARVA